MRLLLAFPTLLALPSLPLRAEEPSEPPGRVALRLELTVRTFDPAAPLGELKGYVKNLTDAPLELPEAYDGNRFRLLGGKLTLCVLRRCEAKPTRSSPLAPGAEREVFAFPLAEILNGAPRDRLRRDDPYADLLWDWAYLGSPPPSPIHRYGWNDFRDETTFVLACETAGEERFEWADLQGFDHSPPATLRVSRSFPPAQP